MKTLKYFLITVISLIGSNLLFSHTSDADNWLMINGSEFNGVKVILKPASDMEDNFVIYTTGNDMTNLTLGASYNDKPCNIVANITGNKPGSAQSIYINVQINGAEYISTAPVTVTIINYGAVGAMVSGSFTATLMNMTNGQSINAEVHFAAMRKADM